MGTVWSCLPSEDFGGHDSFGSSAFRYCGCFRCFSQQLITMYTSLFRRGEVRGASLSMSSRVALASPVPNNDSNCDTYRSPPRPLPYDDPRCSRLQCEKSSSNLNDESEPLRGSKGDNEAESLYKCKLNYEGCSKLCISDPSLKHPSKEVMKDVLYIFPSSEDEDVCPTCLDEYTSENPRIIMQCTHHFHLGCIYEWMERSEACPVCGKMMVFNEST